MYAGNTKFHENCWGRFPDSDNKYIKFSYFDKHIMNMIGIFYNEQHNYLSIKYCFATRKNMQVYRKFSKL